MASVTTVVCKARPTELPNWLTVVLDTGGPYRLTLCVPVGEVLTEVRDEASPLERGLISSLLALGQRPSTSLRDHLRVEVCEVGTKSALVRVRTCVGPVMVRVPLAMVR
jgi:hypothetical protein